MSMDRKTAAATILPAAVLAVTTAMMPNAQSVAMMPNPVRAAHAPTELRYLHGPELKRRKTR